ncbi:MAG: UvrB/UvrC motif-containing protein [Peptococcaceae bacterium]|nr:UvrB/UvrC motif-containing protein [Peptococcaceae bacterium]
MRCEKCGKREATVHLQTIIGGVSHSAHLCSACAAKEENSWYNELASFFDRSLFDGERLREVFATDSKRARVVQVETADVCPACGKTWEDFQRDGLLGCSKCYKHFAERLPESLTRLHGISSAKATTPDKIAAEKLREDLDQAIKAEHFEEAARLRDALKALDNSGADSGS